MKAYTNTATTIKTIMATLAAVAILAAVAHHVGTLRRHGARLHEVETRLGNQQHTIALLARQLLEARQSLGLTGGGIGGVEPGSGE